MTATNETSAGRRTTAKVIGSLGVIAAAAAVAGIGTFGTFTDSTAMAVDLDAGIVSIDLSVPGGPRMIPVMMNNFVPGDSLTRGVNLTNDGDAALSTVRLLSTVQASSSVLADPANGLQLSLTACSRAWSRGGTNELPTYTCGGTQSTLYSGPATADEVLVDPDSLAPGGTDKLVFTISLPGTAGNDVQGSSATVSLAFTAVQRAGDSR